MSVAAPISIPPSASREASTNKLDLLLLMLGAALLYSLNVDFTLYGDAALYSDFVVLRKFDEVTLHLGYYLLLFVADKLLGGLFGIPIQESAAWLNVAAGTLSVGVAYALARELFGTRRDALLCAIIFGLSGRVLNNATGSEMYMLQTLFVLSSFYLFVRGHVFLSGLLGGVAMLVSPLSAFAYLFYPVYDYQRAERIRWPILFRLTGAALIIYLPFLIVDGHEMLWGIRGLLTIHKLDPYRPSEALQNFPIYQFKAFTVLLLLLIPALLAWRENRRMFALGLAVGIPHLYILLKLTQEDHVFILNTDFFFACCLVIGWRQLEKLKLGRWIAPGLLLGHAAVFILSGTIHSFQPHRDYADEMRRVAKTYLLGHNSIMVADWGRAVALTFYGRPSPTTTLLQEPLFVNQIYDIQGNPLAPHIELDGHEVFLLDAWAPSPLNRFFRTKQSLEAVRHKYALVFVAARELNLHCSLVEETVHRIYRCAR